jgi:hypothetical protein
MADLTVSYNGFTFEFTPYVTRTVDYAYIGSKSYRTSKINIEGAITGEAFDAIDTQRNNIINAFDEDFKQLVAGNYTFDNVLVKNLSFPEDDVGLVRFSIDLESYDHFFRNSNIVDPANNFTYTENQDGTVFLTHTVSARAINTGDTNGLVAVAQAKTFCDSLVGIASRPSTTTGISAGINFGGTPFSTRETSNRSDGFYLIEETYKQGVNSQSGYVEAYSIDLTEGIENDYSIADLSYSIKGPPTTSLNTLRGLIPSNDEFQNKIFTATNSSFDGREPISYSITEHAGESLIELKASFAGPVEAYQRLFYGGFGTGPSDIYSKYNTSYYHSSTSGYATLNQDVDLSTDYVTEKTTVSVNARMVSKGDLATRNARVEAWINSLLGSANTYDRPQRFLWGIAEDYYDYSLTGNVYYNSEDAAGYGGSLAASVSSKVFEGSTYWNLNPEPINFIIDKDTKRGEINLRATFDNRDYVYTDLSYVNVLGQNVYATNDKIIYFKNFDFYITKDCCMPVYSLEGSINPLQNHTVGNYKLFSHERLSQELTSLSVNAVVADDASTGISVVNSRLGKDYLNLCDGAVLKITAGLEPRFVGSESRTIQSQDSQRDLLPISTYPAGASHLGVISKSLSYTTLPSAQFLDLSNILYRIN